jgi:uncharacterized LabA/DUF88 family protein
MSVDLPKMAVYFDAENIGLSCVAGVLRYLEERKWDTYVKRAYGGQLHQGAEILREFSVVPVHVVSPRNKKNIADIALIIDAMQELCLGAAEAFCIVTGDSDFTLLVQRIRERGKTVLVCGNQATSAGLRNACTQFLELRMPGDDGKAQQAGKEQSGAAKGKASAPVGKGVATTTLNLGDPEVAAHVRAALRQAFLRCANGREAVTLSDFGNFIALHAPEVSRKRYGVGMLRTMLKAVGGFEIIEASAVQNGRKAPAVRLRDGSAQLENAPDKEADDGGAVVADVGDPVSSGADRGELSQ